LRGQGLILGFPLRKSAAEQAVARLPVLGPLEQVAFGQSFAMELLETHGVLCQVTDSHTNLLKFTPPLVIDEAQCDAVVRAVDATFGSLSGGLRATATGAMHALRNVVGRA